MGSLEKIRQSQAAIEKIHKVAESAEAHLKVVNKNLKANGK